MGHMGLGQIGDGRKGDQIAYVAVQRFHNRGNAAERDRDGAHVGSLVDYENKSVLIIRNDKKKLQYNDWRIPHYILEICFTRLKLSARSIS